METNGSSNTVDEAGIGHTERDDIGQIDFHKIGFSQDRLIGDIGNEDED